jgi:methionyl-tRNA synthetase
LTFAQKNYGETKTIAAEKKLVAEFSKISEEIRKNYFEMDFKSTVKNLLRLGELGNAYFQKAEPWKNKEGAETKAAVGLSVNFARNLALLLSPILPQFSRKVAQVFVGKGLAEKEPENEWRWEQISFDWKGKLNPIELLVEKIETVPQASKFPLQMVVGQIKSVKDHPNADTLYLMKVDLGPKLGERQVVAGLRKYFSIQTLLQRKAVFCANLKPAKLRGELSEAMVFAADDGEKVALLEAEKTPIGEEVFFSGLENSTQQVEFDEFKRLVLSVSQGKVEYQGKRLVSKVEEVAVRGVKDGARIY